MKLRIYFTDLVAFVPSADRKQMTAVLLDTRQMSARHRPVLVIPGSGLVPTYRDLEDEDLRIAEAPSNGGLQIAGTGSPIADQFPRAATQEHFSWVPYLAPGACKAKSSVLGSAPNGLVVARFYLTAGRISTYNFVEMDQRIYSYSMNGQNRALADIIQYEVEVPGDQATITSWDFEGNPKNDPLVIQPHQGEELSEILVTNMPPPSSPNGNGDGIGIHFSHFYRITQGAMPNSTSIERCDSMPASSLPNPPIPDIVGQVYGMNIDTPNQPENCYGCQTC